MKQKTAYDIIEDVICIPQEHYQDKMFIVIGGESFPLMSVGFRTGKDSLYLELNEDV